MRTTLAGISVWLLVAMASAEPATTGSAKTKKAASVQTIRIDHRTGLMSPTGSVGLARGDELRVAIDNTYPDCYRYNVEIVRPTPGAREKAAGAPPVPETVEFMIKHDGRATAYKITASTKENARPECPLKPGSWEISVEPYEWSLALTGAFTVDGLTDPVFFLEPATRPGAPGEPDREGFTAGQDRGKEDDFTLGLASMIHLFHSNPAFARVFFDDVSWVPVSFGIAVAGEDSAAKYFVGTSLKAGSKFYLTVGAAFGPVHRLPNGVDGNSFLTDANALNSLPSRRVVRPFLALSYSFIDVSPSRFKNLFIEPKPEPTAKPNEAAEPASGDTDVSDDGKPGITIDPAHGEVGTPVTITLTGMKFTGKADKDKILVGGIAVPLLNPATPLKMNDTEAEIAIPQRDPGDVEILVEIDGVKSAPRKFKVTPAK